MSYKDEWLVIEANDDIDEMEHREPGEEFLFYRAVANGDVDAVRKNCEQGRFMDTEGVGVLSRDPITNLKYHFVVTTAMVTRMCRQHGMELERAFRLSDFYIQKLDDIHTADEIKHLHDEMVMDYTEKMRRYHHSNTNSKHINACKEYIYAHIKERITIEDLRTRWGCLPAICPGCSKKRPGFRSAPTSATAKLIWPKTCCGSATTPWLTLPTGFLFPPRAILSSNSGRWWR